MSQYQDCTVVSPQCPVSATTYGYYPNLAGNVILCVVFGVCLVAQFAFSWKGRTWSWLVALACGCGCEFAGYVGRLLMNSNPWNQSAFRLQIITLIIGPSFIAAGIDLTLKHLVILLGAENSLLKPTLYTWGFISVDIFAILLQAAGGGLAASGNTNQTSLLEVGNNVILAGIAVQVAQLICFGIVSAVFAWKVFKQRRSSTVVMGARLKFFLCCDTLAYVCILIRCIYRLPEMAGGWGSPLQHKEVDFLLLDGTMVALAAVALTVAHPTFCFPQLGKQKSARPSSGKSELTDDVEKITNGVEKI